MGFSRGFDHFVGYDDRGAPAVNAAVDALALDYSSPYFLYLHYMDPHEPYVRREAHYDEAASGGKLFANYDSEIGYTDAHVGALLARLNAGPDTLVIVTSDHGEEFGDHGNHGHRNQLYDELLHVPLIISWPKRLAPRRVAHQVSIVDLLPTVLSLLNIVGAGEGDMGTSLIPSLGQEQLVNRPTFAMRWSEQFRPPLIRRAVIWQHWKYIWSVPSGRRELYDTSADPDERENLHEQRRELAGDLHQRLLRFEQSARVYERAYTAAPELTDQLEQKLRALGYTEE
jgi:arylsulfatase A-like enzyme